MANPFKEAEKKRKTPPGGANQPAEEPTPVEPVAETPVVESESAPMVGTDFLAGKMEPKPEGKTVGFYLSNDAIKKLDKLAKQLKCSKSKALDTLIKNVLE